MTTAANHSASVCACACVMGGVLTFRLRRRTKRKEQRDNSEMGMRIEQGGAVGWEVVD
jgi:hypothetical protein